MTVERTVSRIFILTEENWMKHSNPWSVGSRYTVLPFIVLAFWSRTWIGWWCLLPGIVAISWMFVNPIIFSKPLSTQNWASKAVLGERVYLNRDKIPLIETHQSILNPILHLISAAGMLLAIWATSTYSVWGAITGTLVAYLAKSWYLDRMVWLYEDMKNQHAAYKSWEY